MNGTTTTRRGAEAEEMPRWARAEPAQATSVGLEDSISNMASIFYSDPERFRASLPILLPYLEELTRRCGLIANGDMADEFGFLIAHARPMADKLMTMLGSEQALLDDEARRVLTEAKDALLGLIPVTARLAVTDETAEQEPELQGPMRPIPYMPGQAGAVELQWNPMTRRIWNSDELIDAAAGVAEDVLLNGSGGSNLLQNFADAIQSATGVALTAGQLASGEWGDADEYIMEHFAGANTEENRRMLMGAFRYISNNDIASAIQGMPSDSPLYHVLYDFTDYFLEHNVVVFRLAQISIGASASVQWSEHFITDVAAYEDTILLGRWQGNVETLPDGRRRITYSSTSEWTEGARAELGLRFPITNEAEFIRVTPIYEYSPEMGEAGAPAGSSVFRVRIEAVDGQGQLLQSLTEGYLRLSAFGEFDVTNQTFEAGGMAYIGSFDIQGVKLMLNIGASYGGALTEGATPMSPNAFLSLQEGASLLIPVHNGTLRSIDISGGAVQVLAQNPDGSFEPVQYGGRLALEADIRVSNDFQMRPYIGASVMQLNVAPDIARELYDVRNGDALTFSVGAGIEFRYRTPW